MIHVLTVVGTRPEAIKMAPVIQELRRRPDHFLVRVCATAQHREMLDQVFSLFGIVPDVDLDLMEPDQTPAQVAARVLLNLEPVLRDQRPDWVLVQGDTTSVLAAALCANYHRVQVGHVEAGLRSFDRANPFPEEMNRVVADQISDLLFAPTAQARQNLLREGVPESRIVVTGNTVIDALLAVASQPWQPPEGDPLRQLDSARRWALVTAHRRENLGAPLRDICTALRTLAGRGDVQVIYPVHLNPGVWGPVHEFLGDVPGVLLLPPVDYRCLVYLLQKSHLVLTDSGGIQEEAPSLGVPVLVLREVTERPEGVAAGTARLVGTEPQRIVAEAARLLDDAAAHRAMAQAANPYGDGQAAQRIVQALLAVGG
ncbi:MAG: UDP-N-acetylglucosamine 2-epimerase (non-hydrolyzing) [Chloroflexi bacterium]|nr:UDP-N-acetylglucosamine 2-epimerase (non-hydrolyzing) [Chloroflexota bacterium]